MDLSTILLVTWFPLLVHLSAAGYVAMDAPDYGMNRRLWTGIALLIPIFGFFAYLLERSEQTPDPDRSMFEDGVFEIHESRADDTRLASGGPDEPAETDREERTADGPDSRE